MDALAEFRESVGLAPPPRTLSPAASRLVDLLDEFLRRLTFGWDIPPGLPADRFVPTVWANPDLVAPILQYVADLGFTGDACRLDEVMGQFYAIRECSPVLPDLGDDEGWEEVQQQYVDPLRYRVAVLRSVVVEIRQLIINAAVGGDGKPSDPALDAQQTDPMGGGDDAKPPPQPPTQKKHLATWREILIALEMKSNDENRQKVDRLNETYNGPIIKPGQGKQPFADKDKLLEWWNGLEEMVQSQANRARDTKETVKGTHAYGRKGEVVPEISGSVKRRRRDRQP